MTKGIAWSVPAVAIAGAAPAFAASRCVPEPVIDGDKSCKKANENSYKIVFKIAGDNCDPGACSGTITKVWEATGQGRTLFSGSHPADGNTPLVLCNTYNMSANVMVEATINCGGNITQFSGEVDVPQFNSAAGCDDPNFCVTPS
ncbi:hypothetical protein [Tessaracoccus sp. G1721]